MNHSTLLRLMARLLAPETALSAQIRFASSRAPAQPFRVAPMRLKSQVLSFQQPQAETWNLWQSLAPRLFMCAATALSLRVLLPSSLSMVQERLVEQGKRI